MHKKYGATAKQEKPRSPRVLAAMKFQNDCGRKIRHTSTEEAQKHVDELGDSGLNIYLCKHCHGYHVGHRYGAIRAHKYMESMAS